MANAPHTLDELIARWSTDDGKPYKGELIDFEAYEPGNLSCMCAQGQLLHAVAGWTPEQLDRANQVDADKATAKLLNISVAHAILLRQVNDKIDGAPAIVLTDPGKVLGSEWSKLLDFWWHLDQMSTADWQAYAAARAAARAAAEAAARAAAEAAARAAAWAAAGTAAGTAAWAAAGTAAGAAPNAASEIQGAHLLREQGKPFFFLPLFGFADPEAIPARPANYGEA